MKEYAQIREEKVAKLTKKFGSSIDLIKTIAGFLAVISYSIYLFSQFLLSVLKIFGYTSKALSNLSSISGFIAIISFFIWGLFELAEKIGQMFVISNTTDDVEIVTGLKSLIGFTIIFFVVYITYTYFSVIHTNASILIL